MVTNDGLQAARAWLQEQPPGWQATSLPAGRGHAYVAVEDPATSIHGWEDVGASLAQGRRAAVLDARSGGREAFGRLLVRLVDARHQVTRTHDAKIAARLEGWWPGAAERDEHLVSCHAYGIDPWCDRTPKPVAPRLPKRKNQGLMVARSGEDQLVLAHHADVGGCLYLEVPMPGSRRSIDAVIVGSGPARFASDRLAWDDHDPRTITLAEAKVGGESAVETLLGQICAARAGIAHLYDTPVGNVAAVVVVERSGPLLERTARSLEIPVHVVNRAAIASISFAGRDGRDRLEVLRRIAAQRGQSMTDAINAALDQLDA